MEGWDPFSDDLVNRKKPSSEPAEPDGAAPAIPDAPPPPETYAPRVEPSPFAAVSPETDAVDEHATDDAPVAVPNPERAARAEIDPMARPVPTRAAPVIVVEELKSMEPPSRATPYDGPYSAHVSYGGIPARSMTLPEENLVRPPARLAVPPPISDDDIYAVRETPMVPPVTSVKPSPPLEEPEKRPVTATSSATRSRPSPIRRPASVTGANPASKPVSTDVATSGDKIASGREIPGGKTVTEGDATAWRSIFDGDDVPPEWRRTTKPVSETGGGPAGVAAMPGRTESKSESPHAGEVVPSVTVAGSAPAGSVAAENGADGAESEEWQSPQMIRDRLMEEYEERARRKIEEAEQRERDASTTTRGFFLQPAVLGRIGLISVFGCVLAAVAEMNSNPDLVGWFWMAMAYGMGGTIMALTFAFLLPTVMETFEMTFNRSQRREEWPISAEGGFGIADGIMLLRYPITATVTTGFLVIGIQMLAFVFHSMLWWWPERCGPGQLLIFVTYIVAPACYLLIFPLCYMTELANNDAFDVLPVTVWKVRRVIGWQLVRFYLEQVGIIAAFLGINILVGLLKESFPTVYYGMAVLLIPPLSIFLLMLWHERLGRFAAVCIDAERELEPKRKKSKKKRLPAGSED